MVYDVEIVIVYCYDDAWGCYINNKLEESGNGIFGATQLLRLIDGKRVTRWSNVRLDLDDDTYWDYPRDFSEVVGFAKSIGQWDDNAD